MIIDFVNVETVDLKVLIYIHIPSITLHINLRKKKSKFTSCLYHIYLFIKLNMLHLIFECCYQWKLFKFVLINLINILIKISIIIYSGLHYFSEFIESSHFSCFLLGFSCFCLCLDRNTILPANCQILIAAISFQIITV